MTIRYATRRDAIEQALAPILHDYEYEYDLSAICDETFEWAVGRDAAGNELVNTGGFEQIVTGERFWEIAAKHEIV